MGNSLKSGGQTTFVYVTIHPGRLSLYPLAERGTCTGESVGWLIRLVAVLY